MDKSLYKKKPTNQSLKEMAAEVLHLAMEDAGVDHVDALFVGNMPADELQGQKHIASQFDNQA